MPAFSKEREQEYISRLRRLLVLEPDISERAAQAALEAGTPPLHLDRHYISKLFKKIHGERTKRLDNYTINHVLSGFADEQQELRRRLFGILSDPTTSARDKIAAIKEIRECSKVMFDKMFDAGVFERQLGKLKTEENLSAEQEALLNEAVEYALSRGKNKKGERG